MMITPHFAWRELDRYGDAGPTERKRLRHLAEQLEILREALGGAPISITYNGGYHGAGMESSGHPRSKGSQHRFARAADIVVRGIDPPTVHATILRLISEGRMAQGGVGRYADFVHYDTRGTPARWGRRL